MKVPLLPVCLLLASSAGVHTWRSKEVRVKSGELVALQCRGVEDEVIWTNHTAGESVLTGVVLHGKSLVILSASVNHQGNYSCSPRTDWFMLRVYTAQSGEYEERSTYPKTCYTQESCTLHCPNLNIPNNDTPNITNHGITWNKQGESLPKVGYFASVEENDRGLYTCTRSFLYHDQRYNRTFRVNLDVQPHKKPEKAAAIVSPRDGDVFHVDVGSAAVILCKAVTFRDSGDSLVWLIGDSFADFSESSTVSFNITSEGNHEGRNITASLTINKVTKEDLLNNYTCKLESDDQPSTFVSITLALRERPSYVWLAVSVVCSLVGMVLITAVIVKFKISITLFLRDSLGCHRNTSDGKSYDAFLMCYQSDTEVGLIEEDRDRLKSVLEEDFGYSLCLDDRDVLPGKAVAEAVLDCIEQSRTVVLVPTSPDPGLGSGLLSVIHSALVERETRLVFITTESKDVSESGSEHVALQLLREAGDCVTWKGKRSMSLSSSFWKQLRYHLPATQRTPKIRLLPVSV
ncbi:interleukin-18 receptor 1-like [Notolabrus celidotus]|uniref:interleukin-18 receptor 1-like n=1 Tax=Notolabrus celidotus TaxID=1203425 RepID=UPI001490817B|nr:interleukin-18 receptor 1-like [Notolabrus celidotus]